MTPLPSPVDWGLLSRAVAFYREEGLIYVETPWLVSRQATRATLSAGAGVFSCPAGDLVGSAEQGFIELLLQGALGGSKEDIFVSLGPCFRDEPVTFSNHTHFMKVEMFSRDPSAVCSMVCLAGRFAEEEGIHTSLVPTDEGLDLMTLVGGLELGSYGLRSACGHSWAYGTGCAEPRWSSAYKTMRGCNNS